MALEREMATYNRQLQSLLADEGKFVLIKGDDVLGTFDGYEDALKAGYERIGLEPFLVKRIQAVEQIQFITRQVRHACQC